MADDDDRKEFDWDLPIFVPSIGVHRTLRVTSNESVGAVMIKLTSKLGRTDKLRGTNKNEHLDCIILAVCIWVA